MKKAAFHNLGCKVNAYETEAMAQLLEDAGYEIVPFSDMADVYVVNTCSVTGMADRKSRQMIRRARKQNSAAVIVAAGCYVQTDTKGAGELGADILLGNNCKSRLVEELERFWEQRRPITSCLDINRGQAEYEPLRLARTAEHTRAFVKVQDGCNQFCSYCVIPYARGRVRSRAVSDVLEEVGRLARQGYQEVVLTGIHLSSYGCGVAETLADLVEQVCGVAGIRRVRLGSLEPQIVTGDFVKRLARQESVCPHFHLSLQSGCDRTLARMNRKYTTEEYRASCALLRQYYDHPAITTDVIVGFPGETEEEFGDTRRFLEEMHFYEMHVFKFSKREGTRAASMEAQVPEEEKARRSGLLLEMSKRESAAFRRYYIGRTVRMLTEERVTIGGESYCVGFTPEYVRCAVKSQGLSGNQFVDGRVAGELGEDLLILPESRLDMQG